MRVFVLISLTLLLALPRPVEATEKTPVVRHALMIGVSGYDPKVMRPLQAPPNDLRLVYDVLIDRGFQQNDINVLADLIADGETKPSELIRPTRENIVAAFETLVSDISKRSDEQHFVFIYITGHGSRQPQIEFSDDVEPDNFDEVFLPIDVGPIDFATRKIKNGLVDDDIRHLLRKVRDAGNVFVWLVFDSCHAGDMTRGVEDETQAKFIDPIELVPTNDREKWKQSVKMADATKAKDDQLTGSEKTGEGWLGGTGSTTEGIAVFAAAEADKLALELRIAEADNKVFSAFTYNLVKAIKRETNPTYRALARSVDREYAAFQENLPSPVYEGVLDKQINFSNSGQDGLQWPAAYDAKSNTVILPIGVMSGVNEGSILGIQDSQTSDNLPIGYLEVETARLNHATAKPVEFNGQAKPSPEKLKEPFNVTLARRRVSLSLRVAASFDSGSDAAKLAEQAVRLLREQAGATSERQLDWVQPGEQADVHLRESARQLLILPRTGSLDRADATEQFGIALNGSAEKIATDLQENLWRLLRKKNLLRIAAAMPPGGASDLIEVRMFRIPGARSDTQKTDQYKCPAPDMAELNNGGTLLDPTTPLKLKHCDVLRIEVSNNSNKRVQVTALLIGSDAGISVFDIGNRPVIKPESILAASSFIQIVTWCSPTDCEEWGLPNGAQSVGREQLLLLVTELADGAAPSNLSYLAQPSLSMAKKAADKTFRSKTSELERLMGQAGLFPKTRSVAVGKPKDARLEYYRWEVVR